MIQKSFVRHAVAVLAGLALLLGLPAATSFAATEKVKKTSPAKQGSTKFLPGSQENRKEREKRLKRECKGRVNAGACEGYTH